MGKFWFFVGIVILLVLLYLWAAPTGQDAAPAPPAPTPVPQAQIAPQSSVLDIKFQALAKDAGVTATVLSQNGRKVRLRVEWGGDQATLGGDYLLLLYRNDVISNFDEKVQGSQGYDSQGRRRWIQETDVTTR